MSGSHLRYLKEYDKRLDRCFSLILEMMAPRHVSSLYLAIRGELNWMRGKIADAVNLQDEIEVFAIKFETNNLFAAAELSLVSLSNMIHLRINSQRAE